MTTKESKMKESRTWVSFEGTKAAEERRKEREKKKEEESKE